MINTFRKINKRIGKSAAWLVLLLVLVTVCDVMLRYFFKAGSVALQELEWHLFAAVFLLTAAWCWQEDSHVRVDVLYSRFQPKTKAWVNLVFCLLFALPFFSLLIWSSLPFAWSAFQTMESSPDPGGLPYRFIVRSFIPLSALMLISESLAQIARDIGTIRGASNV